MTGPGAGPEPSAARRHELAVASALVEARVAAACTAAGRPRSDVTLVAVSKTWPASDVVGLRDLGQFDFGENRDAEVADKATVVDAVRWHFVGQVQSRKAAAIAAVAHVVHSVDRAKTVTALSRGAVQAGREVRALLQVSLDGDPSRGGASRSDLAALADLVAEAPGLVLAGVMAVAPVGADPDAAFAVLQDVAADLRTGHAAASWVSAGMSGDLEQAVRHGATHLRVGTALFGGRPVPLR